jgi:alcohol dehydrogenase
MKAARIYGYGDASSIKLEEANKPEAGDGQVLIEVYASSINPFDVKLRSGLAPMVKNFPFTLGGDVAGVVAELGNGVSNFAVGDKVYGQAAGVAGNSGALAEFAATSADQVAKMPAKLDFKQAASLPLVGVSAWQALTEHIKLQPGQKIFIHGGAGGIGSIAIQIAKHIGVHVATTATGSGVKFVKSLGADEVIDYKKQDFATSLSDFDAVFDTVGGDDFNKALSVLKNGGKAVSMIAQADEAKTTQLGVTAITQATQVNTHKLEELAKLVDRGAIKPQVAEVFNLDQVQDAFKAYESGQVKGKVVVEVKS